MAPTTLKSANNSAKKLGTGRDITDDVEEHLFVPYAVHYDPHTILTQNGELLQTIKIVGFAHEDITRELLDLRALVRSSIKDCIHTTDYALWFHTIRKRQNLSPAGGYRKDFSGYLNRCWHERNKWSEGYTNEVYITVVKEGEGAKLKNPKNLLRGVWPPIDIRARNEFLMRAHADLNETVENILGILSDYGAARLGVYEKDGVYYSEPCAFLGKLITLNDNEWPVPEQSLAKYLTEYEITFGYNALEVQERNGKHRFGALVTLKEYRELPLGLLERFLQLPAEFIISQSMVFVSSEKAKPVYEYQDELFRISKSPLRERTGLAHVLENAQGTVVDFGEQQTTIFPIADSLAELDKGVKMLVDTLEGIGIMGLREDIKLEECYWAQLPSNFEFMKRLQILDTPQVAGFANLSNFPAGRRDANHWGPAVSVMRTVAGTPYYFNFHIGDVGHTSIIGPKGSGKTVLLNFLLAQAQKFRPQLIYLDQNRSSEIFIRSLGGTYQDIKQIQLNPFALADSPEHRRFMAMWLFSLTGKSTPDAAQLGVLRQAVDHVMLLPAAERGLKKAVEWIAANKPELATEFAPWVEGGKYGTLFTQAEDKLSLDAPALGFNMTEVMADPLLHGPVLSYLLHRINLRLSGAPVMIALDDAWKLLNTPLFADHVGEWMAKLTKHNAMAVFMSENHAAMHESAFSGVVMENIATQVYLPEPVANQSYIDVFGLTEQEQSIIHNLEKNDRRFMLKRGKEAILTSVDLTGMKDCLHILSADKPHIELMEQCILTRGDDPGQWIPQFLKKL